MLYGNACKMIPDEHKHPHNPYQMTYPYGAKFDVLKPQNSDE